VKTISDVEGAVLGRQLAPIAEEEVETAKKIGLFTEITCGLPNLPHLSDLPELPRGFPRYGDDMDCWDVESISSAVTLPAYPGESSGSWDVLPSQGSYTDVLCTERHAETGCADVRLQSTDRRAESKMDYGSSGFGLLELDSTDPGTKKFLTSTDGFGLPELGITDPGTKDFLASTDGRQPTIDWLA